jgi:hypothetical protein
MGLLRLRVSRNGKNIRSEKYCHNIVIPAQAVAPGLPTVSQAGIKAE